MNCQGCSAEIADGDIFCGNCGRKAERPKPAAKAAAPAKVKVAAPQAHVEPAPDPVDSAEEKTAPLTPPARRPHMTFFLGAALTPGAALAALIVAFSLGESPTVNLLLSFFGLAFIGLFMAALLKRVTLGGAALALLGAVAGFLLIGLSTAFLPEPETFGIALLFTVALGIFLLLAFISRNAGK